MFTNGLKDPWHLVSISQDVPAPSSVQAVTYDLGHCATLIAATPQDPPSVISARQAVVNFLANALGKSRK
jgi:thymus-specific serine protease